MPVTTTKKTVLVGNLYKPSFVKGHYFLDGLLWYFGPVFLAEFPGKSGKKLALAQLVKHQSWT